MSNHTELFSISRRNFLEVSGVMVAGVAALPSLHSIEQVTGQLPTRSAVSYAVRGTVAGTQPGVLLLPTFAAPETLHSFADQLAACGLLVAIPESTDSRTLSDSLSQLRRTSGVATEHVGVMIGSLSDAETLQNISSVKRGVLIEGLSDSCSADVTRQVVPESLSLLVLNAQSDTVPNLLQRAARWFSRH
jgi:hypothetical protein